MLDRNPLAGPPISGKDTGQPYPGTERDRTPNSSGEVLAITGTTSGRG